jgi:hypothetical protein
MGEWNRQPGKETLRSPEAVPDPPEVPLDADTESQQKAQVARSLADARSASRPMAVAAEADRFGDPPSGSAPSRRFRRTRAGYGLCRDDRLACHV